jgi:hypothetical protein
MDSDVLFVTLVVMAMIAAVCGLFVLVSYAVGWAILYVAGVFWGYPWPGFWAALVLGLAIMILISAMRSVVRHTEE